MLNKFKYGVKMISKLFAFQEVSCPSDETFQQIVQTAVTKLYQSLAPPQVESSTSES